MLTRPRLLRALLGRWHHRVTCLIGGPGLGKTTLLAQAMAENGLARRGNDVWVGVEPGDGHSERLASAVAVALGRNAAVAAGVANTNANAAGRATMAGAGPDDPAATGTNTGLALPTEPAGTVDPGAVADAVWHRAPAEVCLVFDDVHLLPVDSPGATWLAALVDALPANGHVLLASRSEPPIPLARLAAQAAVLRVDETCLLYTSPSPRDS